MGEKAYKPPVIVTDSAAGPDHATVTDPATRNSVTVPNTVAGVAQGIKDVVQK